MNQPADVSDIVDAQQIKAGPASAISGSPGYTCLLAMVAAGDARYGGDQYFTDGSRAIMADVLPSGHTPARNPEEMHLIIDPGYFERAEQEYSTPWRLVWWREAIQNAVDAKAKNLNLSVDDAGDFMKVTCIDDGTGMDKDTLQNKFLALGGTTKGQAGQIGGFGVAKKILCFRWPQWLIHTREHLLHSVDGRMEYEQASYREGTLLEVLMPKADNMYTTAYMAQNFLERCNLSGVRVTIDGTPWGGRWLPNGKHIRNLQGDRVDAKVYYTKESKLVKNACYIRTGEGLFMHERYLSDEIKGYVIVELVAKENPKTGKPYPSRDFLSASRDDLTDVNLKLAVVKMITELAVDTTSGLKSKAAAKIEKYVGPGGMFKPEFQALYSNVVYNMDTDKTRSGYQLTEQARERISEMLGSSTELNQELMSELLHAKYGGANQIEAALFHLTAGFWKRNFLIYPDPDLANFNIPKRFKPEHQTPGLHKLARTWADLCTYVMVALNCKKDFGVGWVFSDDMSACHLKRPGERGENEDWLLLNPFIIDRIVLRRMGVDDRHTGAKLKENPEWTATDRNHLRVLFALAIHECTHFVDDISYHSEGFSSAVTHNTALAGPGFTMLERVARAARAAARTERETDLAKPEPAPVKAVHYEIRKIREDLFALLPDSTKFYETDGWGTSKLFRITGERDPEPESNLYKGIPILGADPSLNVWYAFRKRIGSDALGNVDAFPLANPSYWGLRDHYKKFPTLIMAATAEMHKLLKVYAAMQDIWPDASFHEDVRSILTARDQLDAQLHTEANAYFAQYPWETKSFKRFEAPDFRMAYCLATYLSSPKWSVMDGISIWLDSAVARAPESMHGQLVKVLNETDHIADDLSKPAMYSVYAMGVPIPDRRHTAASVSIILARSGQAWVQDDDEHLRFVTTSGFYYSAPYSEEIRMLSELDPVMYGNLILALQRGLKAAYKYAVMTTWFKREGWPDTRTGVAPEESVLEEMVREIYAQLQRLKETGAQNTGRTERLVIEEASAAGLIE